MKKRMTRNISIMAVLTLLMGVVLALYISNTSSVPDADNSAAYGDGEYTAAAAGYLNDVTVTVTIAGGQVSAVEIDASGETPALGGQAAQTLAPLLAQAGSPSGVDAVSGSTMTSKAVFEAMNDCLAQAALE